MKAMAPITSALTVAKLVGNVIHFSLSMSLCKIR